MSHRFNTIVLKFFFSALILSAATLHAQPAPRWERYDESADLAQLALHANESMHFRLLNSQVLDKNTLWEPFALELAEFGAQRYEALKPLVLNRSVSELQQAVARGELDYATLTTFYIYRIREIESDDRR